MLFESQRDTEKTLEGDPIRNIRDVGIYIYPCIHILSVYLFLSLSPVLVCKKIWLHMNILIYKVDLIVQ